MMPLCDEPSSHVLSPRFQWVFCQLETLRHAVQPDVRAILKTLPRTLDETYERILKNINENNRKHARRLLHCLAFAVRPLCVEELAEILAFDFDGAQGAIPELHAARRPINQEAAVLSACSSLISIVDHRGSRVVQFAHMSVKEFLISHHRASSTGDLSRFYILPITAHTILAQACLGILLHSGDNDNNDKSKCFPLAGYAAQHWVTHAQFQDVASHVLNGMKSLFDLDKPHFKAWISLYDVDAHSSGRLPSEIPSPLYYSALCGFHDLAKHLADKHPEQLKDIGGSYGFPVVAGLCRNKFGVAELLLELGGKVDVRAQDTRGQTALHKIIDRRDKVAIEAVDYLLQRGADVNARREDLWTPLHVAANVGALTVARALLDNRADVNSRNDDDQTPLHLLSSRDTSHDEGDSSDLAKLLLERGANVNGKDKNNATPLHMGYHYNKLSIVRVLLDHGANTENSQSKILLHKISSGTHIAQGDDVGLAQLFPEHGAAAIAQNEYHISASDCASYFGTQKIREVLFGDRTELEPESNRDKDAFRLWIEGEFYTYEHSLGVKRSPKG